MGNVRGNSLKIKPALFKDAGSETGYSTMLSEDSGQVHTIPQPIFEVPS